MHLHKIVYIIMCTVFVCMIIASYMLHITEQILVAHSSEQTKSFQALGQLLGKKLQCRQAL